MADFRSVEHRCVGCRAPLVAAHTHGYECEHCPHCGGVWIAEATLLSLLRATPTAQHPDELMEHNDGSPRRGCPHCGLRMNLAWIDFLQLDRCPEHGVWLDKGELSEALRSGIKSKDTKALEWWLKKGHAWKPGR